MHLYISFLVYWINLADSFGFGMARANPKSQNLMLQSISMRILDGFIFFLRSKRVVYHFVTRLISKRRTLIRYILVYQLDRDEVNHVILVFGHPILGTELIWMLWLQWIVSTLRIFQIFWIDITALVHQWIGSSLPSSVLAWLPEAVNFCFIVLNKVIQLELIVDLLFQLLLHLLLERVLDLLEY